MGFAFRCLFGVFHSYKEEGDYYVCRNCGHKKKMLVRRQDGILRSRKQKEWGVIWSIRSFITGIVIGISISLLTMFFKQNLDGINSESTDTYVGILFYFTGLFSLYLFIVVSMFLALIFSVRRIHFIVPRKKIVIFISGVSFGLGLITIIELSIPGIEKLF